MRILHISEAFGGGLRSAIVNYLDGSPEHEHELFVRTRVGHETLDVPERVTAHEFSGSMPKFLVAAHRHVRRGDYDIVHLHSSYAGLLRASLPARTRIVYSPHCYAMEAHHSRIKAVAYWSVERVLAQRDQMLMAVSPRELELGHRLNHRMPSREVPNAANRVELPFDAHDVSPAEATVAMIGRVAAQKDPAFFAELARRVDPDLCNFVWIGEGDDGLDLLRRAGVTVTGWKTPTETRALLRSASLYFHCAAWEGAPLATLEAAQMGCPVLSRTIASMESLGYPLGGATPRAAADAVTAFFTDDGYRQHVRDASAVITESFSFDRMATRLLDAYAFAGHRLGPPAITGPSVGRSRLRDIEDTRSQGADQQATQSDTEHIA